MPLYIIKKLETANEPKLSKETYELYEYLQTSVSKKLIKLEIFILEENFNLAIKDLDATKIYVISNSGLNSFATSKIHYILKMISKIYYFNTFLSESFIKILTYKTPIQIYRR